MRLFRRLLRRPPVDAPDERWQTFLDDRPELAALLADEPPIVAMARLAAQARESRDSRMDALRSHLRGDYPPPELDDAA
ncbi:MAG TPA: hypothetical protein VH643_22360 [Gemmataceae bacterium]|jgi:hypothetical protein